MSNLHYNVLYIYAKCVMFCIRLQGGMRAVIWTDVFQCFVMLGGMLAVLFKV